jgi:alkylation response protein AidB-like acyl-CoA dehydrogenase
MSTETQTEAKTGGLLALADYIGSRAAERSGEHDRDESFVADSFQALKEAGFFRALVPKELGGAGVGYREMCDAIRVLGTHCGSTALAFSMHCHLVALPVWRWRHEKAPVEGMLKRVASEDLVLISSGGSDWLNSSGTATKVEGGYRVTGRKIFASGCPVGDVLVTSAVYDDPENGATVLHFPVPFKAEGVKLLDTWHVMGMRGTGSLDVELDRVFVPDAAIAARRPRGKWHPLFHGVAMIALPMVYAAYVGVAERARVKAIAAARKKPNGGPLTVAVGRLENAFTQAEMAYERMIAIAETSNPGPETTGRALTARTLAGSAAIETVERAMEVVGGASFYRALGLERAFRDVQGARFHPLQEVPQLEFSGRLALGLDIDG